MGSWPGGFRFVRQLFFPQDPTMAHSGTGRPHAPPRDSMAMTFSGAVKLADLDDYLAPSQVHLYVRSRMSRLCTLPTVQSFATKKHSKVFSHLLSTLLIHTQSLLRIASSPRSMRTEMLRRQGSVYLKTVDWSLIVHVMHLSI